MTNECVIVGGGPSLNNFDWDLLKDRFVIAVNRAYENVPTAQILYFTDTDFMRTHWDRMWEHGGMLIRGAINPQKELQSPRLMYYKLTGQVGLEKNSGCLRHGNNSGYAALNLASVHLRFKTIQLLGIDLKWNGKQSHYHDGHKRVDTDDSMKRWAQNYDTLAPPLEALGVKVYNCSIESRITAFEKREFV